MELFFLHTQKKKNVQYNLVNDFSFQETFFVEFLIGNMS